MMSKVCIPKSFARAAWRCLSLLGVVGAVGLSQSAQAALERSTLEARVAEVRQAMQASATDGCAVPPPAGSDVGQWFNWPNWGNWNNWPNWNNWGNWFNR